MSYFISVFACICRLMLIQLKFSTFTFSSSKSDVQQEPDVEPLVVGHTELIVKKGSVVKERVSVTRIVS